MRKGNLINIDTLLLDKLPKEIEILDSLTYPNSLIFKNSNEIDTIKMALKLGNHFKVWTIYSEKWDCESNFGVGYDSRNFKFKTIQLDGVGNEELIIVMTYMKSYNNIPIWSYVENWQTYTVWNFDNMKLLFSLQTQYNYESYIEDPNDVLKVYNYDIKFSNKQININKKELNFKTFGGQPKIKNNSKYSYKFNGKEFIKVK